MSVVFRETFCSAATTERLYILRDHSTAKARAHLDRKTRACPSSLPVAGWSVATMAVTASQTWAAAINEQKILIGNQIGQPEIVGRLVEHQRDRASLFHQISAINHNTQAAESYKAYWPRMVGDERCSGAALVRRARWKG